MTLPTESTNKPYYRNSFTSLALERDPGTVGWAQPSNTANSLDNGQISIFFLLGEVLGAVVDQLSQDGRDFGAVSGILAGAACPDTNVHFVCSNDELECAHWQWTTRKRETKELTYFLREG